KPKAQTLRDADWAPHKPRIIQLHIIENIPLKNVRDILKAECGFNAELRQYRTRISKWKLDKNVKSKEMKAIVQKSQYRSLVQANRPDLQFKVRDKEVDQEKISRWMLAHGVPQDELYEPSSV
ncbi:hypothetical protein EJ07DRAFT_62316, partial [Lizonia empirigonia]